MKLSRTISITGVLASFAFLPVSAPAQQGLSNPAVRYDARHDVSPPLREMALTPPKALPVFGAPEPMHGQALPEGRPGFDPLAQQFFPPAVHTKTVLSFDGVLHTPNTPFVPDTNGAAGSTQFVEITNYVYAVYDKTTGKTILAPTQTTTLFSGFGGRCEKTSPADPEVIFDHLANRWFVSYTAFLSNANALCIAVSTSSDATGTYSRYEYDYLGFPDYPKFAVWPDAYYGTSNSSSETATPCAYDRNAMLNGASATSVCFSTGAVIVSLLPSDLDGSTLPPKRAPDHYLAIADFSNLQEFDFHVDFAHPKESTFTGPNIIAVPGFTEPCSGIGYCIPQAHGGEEVEALADRLMFRLAYRNFGDHESMVVTHSVTPGVGSSAQSAMRWYELRATPVGSGFTLYQSGTFQDKSASLWMGSTAMDKQGNIALGMSSSSTAKDPSIWYTGRLAGDALGQMEAPTIAEKGTAIETGNEQRWGDYSSMSIDPSDDCTFWYSQMYFNKKFGKANPIWDTRITAFRFDDCK